MKTTKRFLLLILFLLLIHYSLSRFLLLIHLLFPNRQYSPLFDQSLLFQIIILRLLDYAWLGTETSSHESIIIHNYPRGYLLCLADGSKISWSFLTKNYSTWILRIIIIILLFFLRRVWDERCQKTFYMFCFDIFRSILY